MDDLQSIKMDDLGVPLFLETSKCIYNYPFRRVHMAMLNYSNHLGKIHKSARLRRVFSGKRQVGRLK